MKIKYHCCHINSVIYNLMEILNEIYIYKRKLIHLLLFSTITIFGTILYYTILY